MKKVKFFYGNSTQELEVPDNAAVLESKINETHGGKSGAEIVREALANPIGSPRLSELAKGKPDCTIIISDHTRPVPSRDILPAMVEELKRGNPEIAITFLVATGFHRATSTEELRGKMGDEFYEKYRENIVVHDAHDPEKNVKIGVLPSGPDCVIDKIAASASLLVAEGFIEPHFFAGYSGGRKSVLPGVADATTIMGNHCAKFIDSPYARTGILENNPMHNDMVAGARMAKLAFICNVVIDKDKKTVMAFAGDFEKAHLAGCNFIADYVRVNAAPADIVISTNGGYPLDQNIYQSTKGLTSAEATAKDGGVIIMLSECRDGSGGEYFYHTIADATSAEEAYAKFLATAQKDTVPDQWCAQILARVLCKHQVIFVADPSQRQTVEDLKMTYAPDIKVAYEMARRIKGDSASVTCIPNGVGVVVKPS